MARPIVLTLSPSATSVNNISLLQTTAGAGSFLLNGSTAGALELAHRINLASTGNISAVTFTITGTDSDSNAISETLAGPNNNTVTTVKYYKTVTSVAVNGAVGTNTSVGTSSQIMTQTIPLNTYRRVAHTVNVEITGTVAFTLQETFDNIYSQLGNTAIWQNVPSLTTIAITSSVPAAYNSPGTIQAIGTRLVTTSYSSTPTIKLIILQAAGTDDD